MELHKPPFQLKELKLEVTHDCYLKCVHCSSIAEADTRRQMSYQKCLEILRDATAMGVQEITFSGGEPILWGPLADAVKFSVNSGMKVALYTTGNVDKREAIFYELKLSGLHQVMFSLFGEDKVAHESITNVEGSFDVTLDAIQKCVELGLDTELHFVPFPNNYKSLREIAELGKGLGVKRISVLRLVPQGRGADKTVQPLMKKENKALRKLIIELREEGHEIRTGSPFNALLLRDRPQCCSGIDRLTVSPELKIFPCDAFKQISSQMLGVDGRYSSLEHFSLKECWEKSPYFLKIRNYLTSSFAKECHNCRVLEKCLSGCVAQKFHAYGKLVKCADPMCLLDK